MVDASLLITQALHGLAFGMTLLLLSLGFSLVFGVAGVVNFAHGALYAVGAYAAWHVYELFGSVALGIVVSVIFVTVLGGAIEISILRPLYGRDPLFQLLATFGLIFILEGTIVNLYGTTANRVPVPEIFRGPVDIFGVLYPKYRLVIVVITVILTIILWLVLRTNLGARIRAATYDADMVDALGTDTYRMYTGIFMVGAGLAALAGGMAGPIFTVYPDMGTQVIITIFIVVVIGGLGSFSGAIVGSIIIGESIMLGQAFIGGYAEMLPYLAMIIVLLVRPRGLMGHAGVEL